ncbi:MAG: hypothetical protein WD712_03075 [Candidatus Spechtbacterales bacterium]
MVHLVRFGYGLVPIALGAVAVLAISLQWQIPVAAALGVVVISVLTLIVIYMLGLLVEDVIEDRRRESRRMDSAGEDGPGVQEYRLPRGGGGLL